MSGPQETLKKLGIPLDEFDLANVAKLDAALAELEADIIKGKEKHYAVRAERQVLTAKWNELGAARAYYIHEVRSPQEGDVVAGVPPIGGDNDS